jgi:hypothetical protein
VGGGKSTKKSRFIKEKIACAPRRLVDTDGIEPVYGLEGRFVHAALTGYVRFHLGVGEIKVCRHWTYGEGIAEMAYCVSPGLWLQ